jgi:hypothetical protein
MSRAVFSGALVRSQVDFYSIPGVRIVGITPANLTPFIFVNNSQIVWPVINGNSVVDSSISSGNIYFNEITGTPGFYSVRFFPDRIGYWRIILSYSSVPQDQIIDFDVISNTTQSSGLNASFIK